jgi:hypothetical protein
MSESFLVDYISTLKAFHRNFGVAAFLHTKHTGPLDLYANKNGVAAFLYTNHTGPLGLYANKNTYKYPCPPSIIWGSDLSRRCLSAKLYK